MEFLTDFSISFFDHLQKNGQQNEGHFCVFFFGKFLKMMAPFSNNLLIVYGGQ